MEVLRERGDLPGALHHAVAVGDVQRAATLVVESQTRNLEVGDAQEARAVAREWLARFGEASAKTDPELLLQVVLVLTSYGAREAERWLTALDHAHPDRPPHEDALLHGVWADYLLQRGQAERCLEHNRLARQVLGAAVAQGPVFPRLAELAIQEAGAHLLVGDVSAATVALDRTSPVPQHLVDEFRVPVLRSWVAFLEGDLALARQALGRLGQAGAEHHAALPYGIGRIFASMVRAGFHLEQREFEPASAALAEAASAAEINQRPVILSLVNVWLARLATAQRNHASALAALAHARLVLAAPDERVRAQLAVEEFRIAVALQPDQAEQLIQPLPATNESRLLQARLLVGGRAWAHAGQILATVKPVTLRERIQWKVLLSLATQEHDLASAHDHLRAALALAEPHGYLATLLEQGTGIVSLLQSLPAAPTIKPYIDTLAEAAQTSGHGGRRSGSLAPGDLSSRELTVLELLSSRLTTHEIAGTLFISPNTLKSHVKSIYRKLDVTSRADAVRESHARGLL